MPPLHIHIMGVVKSVEHIFEKEVYFSQKLCYNTPRMRRVGQSRANTI